jgi:hypothetical protein
MRVIAEPRAVDVRSSHQFEEEIGAASSENRLFIAKMEFSVQTGRQVAQEESQHDLPLVPAGVDPAQGCGKIEDLRQGRPY